VPDKKVARILALQCGENHLDMGPKRIGQFLDGLRRVGISLTFRICEVASYHGGSTVIVDKKLKIGFHWWR
jgi:hypothetical protein